MKTVTVNGHRYTVAHCPAHPTRLIVRGRGFLIPGYLPAGTTLHSPNLRELVIAECHANAERRRAASEVVQKHQAEQRAKGQ